MPDMELHSLGGGRGRLVFLEGGSRKGGFGRTPLVAGLCFITYQVCVICFCRGDTRGSTHCALAPTKHASFVSVEVTPEAVHTVL